MPTKHAVAVKFNEDGGAHAYLDYDTSTLLITSVSWENNTSSTFVVSVTGDNTGATLTRDPHSGAGSIDLTGFNVYMVQDTGPKGHPTGPVKTPPGWGLTLTYKPGA